MRNLLLFWVFLCFGANLSGQTVRFAETFNPEGELLNIDSVIAWMPPEKILAVQYAPGHRLRKDTLHVIVRDFYGTVGRYHMKRTKDGSRGNALIRIKGDGIYRVYVYDPASRRTPLAYGRLYILSTQFMTIHALVKHQRQLLIAKGRLPSQQQPQPEPMAPDTALPDNTATNASSADEGAVEDDLGDDLDMSADDLMDDFEDDDFSDFDDFDDGDFGGDIMDDFGDIEDAAVDADVDDILGGDDFDDMDMMDDEEFESFDDMDEDFDFEIDEF